VIDMRAPALRASLPVGARALVAWRAIPVSVWLGLILLIAACLRLAYLIALWASPLFLLNGIRGLDMATYYSMAELFARAQLPDPPAPFFQAPLYPVFLAAIMRLVPNASFALLTTTQVGLGVLACALLYELGRRLVSPAVGLVAAALYAAYPLAWYYGGLLLSENLLVVLLLGLALAVSAVLESPRSWRMWLATGCICGLATVARANIALVLPALVLAVWLTRRTVPWAGIVVAGVAFTVMVLPAAIYNSLAAGSLQFTSTQGNHLWLSGNTEFATGVYQLPCGPIVLPLSVDFWALQLRKLLLFFANEEFGNNTYIGLFRTYLGTTAVPPIGFGPLAALGLFGWLRAPLGSRRWLGLSIVLVVYVGTIVLFAIVGRYRLPAAALLCIPAATVLVQFPGVLRRGTRWRSGLATAAVVAVVMFGANWDLPYDVSIPFAHTNAASVFAEAGDQVTAQHEADLAHATRLEVEAQDVHGCSQIPAF
jgi:4-amino-4-deoxy-L-arabinose transferase-like glycosyltransferase